MVIDTQHLDWLPQNQIEPQHATAMDTIEMVIQVN